MLYSKPFLINSDSTVFLLFEQTYEAGGVVCYRTLTRIKK